MRGLNCLRVSKLAAPMKATSSSESDRGVADDDLRGRPLEPDQRSLIDHDDDVGLLVFSDTVERYLRPARGRRALSAIMDALAAVEGKLAEPDYPGAFAFLATRSRRRAFTVVFTDVIDRTASEALIAHTVSLRARHLPLAVVLRDPSLERLANARPGNTDQAFQRAAAEELLLARAEAVADMRRGGVLVLDVPPAGAARAVTERYEDLKRRGTL